MAFQGTERYVASPALMLAVNAAVTLQRPLLIKGEPGTGKTLLAEELARSLDTALIAWHVKSTTKAQQGCTNTMPSAACAIPSWAWKVSMMYATIFVRANCGKPSRPSAGSSC